MKISSLLPPRWWWLVLLVLLCFAGALRLTGYNFSLPYSDHADETKFSVAAQLIIDTGTSRALNYEGYPPGIITLNYLFLRFFHDPATPPNTVVWMVRLLSITASLVLMIVIALLASKLAAPSAGLLAAGLWGLNPIAIQQSRYGTADTFVALFTVLAVYLVLMGVIYRREDWVTAGILSNLVGIVFKYQAGFVLPLLLIVSLVPLLSSNVDKRPVLVAFVKRMLIVGAFGFWLVFIYPSLEANRIANWVAPTDRITIPSLERIWGEINKIIETNALGGVVVLLAGVGLVFVRRHRKWIALVVGALAFWLAGVGLFGLPDIRQLIGALAFTSVLIGVGFAGWIEILARLKLPRWIPVTLVASVTLVLIVPDIRTALADAYNHTLPDRRNDLASWMDVSVLPGAYVAPIENHKTFSREWGGYAGFNVFPYAGQAILNPESLSQFRADQVMYAIIPYGDYPLLDLEVRSQLLLLKSYPPSPAYRGPNMVVLRLYPIQHAAQGQLGSIHWVGYDISATEATSHDSIQFTLYWQAEQPTDADYIVFNHLVDTPSGAVVAQVDGDPLSDLRRPTTLWDDPDETLISRTFTLSLADLQPGIYHLVTGFYRRDTGERLLSPQNDDSLTITTIRIR